MCVVGFVFVILWVSVCEMMMVLVCSDGRFRF